MKPRLKRYALWAGKLTLSVIAFYIVLSAIELDEVWVHLINAKWEWIVLAIFLLNLAQILSAFRAQYLYQTLANTHMSDKASLVLHYAGALLNVFLPGSISGDGYKAYAVKKSYGVPYLRSARITLLYRGNGMLLLVLLSCVLILLSNTILTLIPIAHTLAIFTGLMTLIGYIIIARLIFKEPLNVQLQSACYSFGIQLSLLLTGWCIALALGITVHILEYIIIFMIANVVIILPISIGGIGLREIVLLQGSAMMGMDTTSGVAIALLFFILHISIYTIGGYCYVRINRYLPQKIAMQKTDEKPLKEV